MRASVAASSGTEPRCPPSAARPPRRRTGCEASDRAPGRLDSVNPSHQPGGDFDPDLAARIPARAARSTSGAEALAAVCMHRPHGYRRRKTATCREASKLAPRTVQVWPGGALPLPLRQWTPTPRVEYVRNRSPPSRTYADRRRQHRVHPMHASSAYRLAPEPAPGFGRCQ